MMFSILDRRTKHQVQRQAVHFAAVEINTKSANHVVHTEKIHKKNQAVKPDF